MKRLARLCLFALIAASPAAVAAQTNSTAPKPAAPKPAASKPAGTTTTRTTRMTTDPALLKPATLTAKAPDVYEVKLTTTKGDIVVQVTRSWAPIGADRFYNLVKHGFYNDAAFFRIVPGFVVQFGLSGDPAVNKAWKNANIKDDPVTQSNKPGTLDVRHRRPQHPHHAALHQSRQQRSSGRPGLRSVRPSHFRHGRGAEAL